MTDLSGILERYRSPLVRDLVWALLSPTLINAANPNYNPVPRWYRDAFHLIEPQLPTLDQDDSPLREHLAATPNNRLGLHFEKLWHWWLLHNGRYQLQAHNLQVIVAQKTLGEFDCIVHDSHAGQTEHWELAVKFYLGIPPLQDARHWFGTNSHDRLDQKNHHLNSKQLVLSETFHGRRLCESRGWPIRQRRLISKGRLYYPYTDKPVTPVAPPCIDPHHLTGYWMNSSAFLQQATQHPKARYQWLNHSEWLAHQSDETQPFSAIKTALEQHEHPLQLRISGWNPKAFRLFVMPESWQTTLMDGC